MDRLQITIEKIENGWLLTWDSPKDGYLYEKTYFKSEEEVRRQIGWNLDLYEFEGE